MVDYDIVWFVVEVVFIIWFSVEFFLCFLCVLKIVNFVLLFSIFVDIMVLLFLYVKFIV